MNRSKYYILLFAVLVITGGCDEGFLSQVPDDRLTMDQVFQRRDLSREYLANIYSYIRDEAFKTNNNPGNPATPWDGLSDDMDITYNRVQNPGFQMNLGNWTPSDYYYDYWPHYYDGIRKATYFMNHIEENTQLLEDPNGKELIARYKAEARFLRAFFYFNILRQYGPVIIMGDDIVSPDTPYDELQLPRSTYDESVNYIAAELDSAAQNLPLHFTHQATQDYGRATKAMCWAVKSRMFLYAASPLFNGNTDYASFRNPDGTPLINQQDDPEKWKRAADAAKHIIDSGEFSLYKEYDSSGDLDPLLSYRNVLLKPWNSEVIFARPGNHLFDAERTQTPRSGGGYSAVGITQSLVDAFEMSNGERPIIGYNPDGSPIINSGSGYQETGFSTSDGAYTLAGTYNMYVGREPRFYASVYYNGSLWINESEGPVVFETHYNGESGKNGSFNYSRSGYVYKKNVSPDTNPRTGEFTPRPYVLYRYAEVLLNYIEALNEYDPGHADIRKYLNEIRERAGLPGVPAGLSQDEMRERIRHERRVELLGEQLRYFDTRRWKIAAETDGGPFYGMNVDADPPQFYQRTVFETRVFKQQFYLFPIGQHELDRNKNLVQNPGW